MPWVHSTKRPWIVYFLQADDSGPIKIGRTRRGLRRRIETIQTCCPYELRLLGVVREHGEFFEQALHARFAHLRVRGEWFRPDAELTAFIRDLAVRQSYDLDAAPETYPIPGLEVDAPPVRTRSVKRSFVKQVNEKTMLAFRMLMSEGRERPYIQEALKLAPSTYYLYLRAYRDRHGRGDS